MRAAKTILIALAVGICLAGIDLLSALTRYNYFFAQILYYASLDILTLIVSALLVYTTGVRGIRSIVLFISVFFAMQSLWNMVYAIMAYYTGTLRFPLNLGLGNFVNVEQYFIGILVQLFLSFLFYIIYRVTSST